jgi:hypothetical protein
MEQGVTNPRDHWQTAGQITDVLLSQEGEVQALVIDAGGFLGGDRGDRRIDIQEVQFVPHAEDQNEFFVGLHGRPADVRTGRDIRRGPAAGVSSAAPSSGATRCAASRPMSQPPRSRRTSSSAPRSTAPDDNWVGDVSDLALTEDGEIEAVIVDVGGFLGIGTHTVALSMEQLQLRRGEGGWFGDDLRAYVNATQEELEQLPEWEEPS